MFHRWIARRIYFLGALCLVGARRGDAAEISGAIVDGLKTRFMAVAPFWQPAGPTAVGIAKLRCARLKRELEVLPEEGDNLSKGPVWLRVTSRPGSKGNCIIAAHRDTHFRFLKDVRAGDTFDIESSGGGRFTYKVTGMTIVKTSDLSLLRPQNRGMLTLVTCYPFFYLGSAPKRFIVRAELLPNPEPEPIVAKVIIASEAGATSEGKGQ